MPAQEPTLIAGITPYFLERGVLWFREHADEIRKQARQDPWWRDRTVIVEHDAALPYSPLLRKLADMGYGKVGMVSAPGEFATRGGIVDVFPINIEHPIRIEFSGNTVLNILPLPVAEKPKPLKTPSAASADEYEKLWLAGLKPGDFVVHIDHGIGIFRGIAARETGNEFFELEYAPPRAGSMPDRLLVPREQSKRIARYVGFETPTVHRLGGTVWETTKRKAREDARTMAKELAAIYRRRAAATRPPYPRFPEIEAVLAASFPWATTRDQERAIAEIHGDLSAGKPMDRLLVGDVGFGKTEVAIRAAVRVAYTGKQVALLVPTTVLADQHAATFRERLGNLPLTVAQLTRLASKRDIKHEIERIRTGQTDIVIGTHRLLSRDIQFKDLGLVIIDEEQRFGVRQKERFKELRANVDILSLSATPIPRTLSLALAKFRDLSAIHEPPHGRIPIQTFILPFSQSAIAEAIRTERKRGGQIFYLWNRINSIELVRRRLERMAKGARIAVLHGRMRETELVRTVHAFRAGEIDILLATTIIENGLDMPNANTLIVANAARLGLAQAHQIRGRVGRGGEQAYAYFFYPTRGMTAEAEQRLEALREAQELGAGFQLALRDLEIRGAGNVLGKQQSGTMNKVGLNLYASLLNEALEEIVGTGDG
ncbi:DEAD/DEAH box helicase [Candidatus Parcubacteria bacterium]|nr:MAG: DEAD/DEAH box helicase [Candidatus Parcubacteria bacterium]